MLSRVANFKWLMKVALFLINVLPMALNILFFNRAPAMLASVTMARNTDITPSQNLLPSTRATMNSVIITASLIRP